MTRKKEMITKRILKSTLALALAGAMLFGSFQIPGGKATLPFGVQTAYAANPLEILCQQEIWNDHFETIRNNLEALQSSVDSLAPADKSIFQCLQAGLAPIGAAGGAFNTVQMVLKMTGVMKDPTATKLANISTTLQGMTATLSNMNDTLKGVAGQLDTVEYEVKDMKRSLTTQNMANKADSFYTNYVNPINDLMMEYEDIINEAFGKWFTSADKDAISIDLSGISLRKEQVASAMQGTTYNVNRYRNTIIQAFTQKIQNLADAKTLTADKDFYASWNNMSEEEKKAEANLLAEECYNTLAGQISCQEMNTHVSFVTRVCTAFSNYCDQLNKEDSPLDAQLKVFYMTHAFEGEVRQDVENALNTAEVVTGTYASMALSLLDQCEMQPESRANTLLNKWTAVTERIANMRSKAFKGYDNYCYLTDSLVVYADRDLHYENEMYSCHSYGGAYERSTYISDSFKTSDLLQDGDKIMGNAEMTMMYKMYEKNAADTGSFYNYLVAEGVGTSEGSNQKLVTKYNGWHDFSVNEGIHMNFGLGASEGGRDYWDTHFECTVNQGNKKDVDNQYFKNCKKATATLFHPENGASENDAIIGAMATYVEHYWYWVRDEMYTMGLADECKNKHIWMCDGNFHESPYDTSIYTSHYAVLLLLPVPEKPATLIPSPLEAFDECQIMTDIQEIKPAVYTEESRTDVNPDSEKEIPVEETETETEETDIQPEEVQPEETEAEDQNAEAAQEVCPETPVELTTE